jgi:tetratricopeptide (TPR) repeat protein
VLALASVLFYLEFAGLRDPDSKNRVWNLTEDWQPYVIGLGFFVLAVLAKTTVVFVPLAILVILWWKRKLTAPRILGALPMLVVGIALAAETSHLETNPNGAIRASGPEWQLAVIQRFLISGRDFWFYIGKLLLPINQSFNYPRVVPNPAGIEWFFFIAAIVVLIGLAATTVRLGRGLFAAVLCYLLLLFPAMGFFNTYPFRFSFVADHFQYLAGIPLVVALVSIAAAILKPLWKSDRPSAAMTVIAALLLIVLGTASWVRAGIFFDPAGLWKDVLKENKNPNSWQAASNLARIDQGDAALMFDEAADLLRSGDQDSSQKEARAALDLLDKSDQLLNKVVTNPTTPYDVLYGAHNQWAVNDVTRLRSPDTDAAMVLDHATMEMGKSLWFPEAQNDPLPFYTLGLVDWNRALRVQKFEPATTQSDAATPESEPTTTESASTTTESASATTRPYSSYERRLVELYEQARDSFQKSIELSMKGMNSLTVGPEAAKVLPLSAYQSGNIDWKLAALAHEHSDVNAERAHSVHAAEDYSLAVRLNPTSEDARYRLALALENIGDFPDAKNQLIVILRDLDHYNADAYNEIGRIILASKPTDMADFEAAVASFKAALKQNPNMTEARKNLDLADKMLATTRPAMRSAAQPATEP